MDSLEVLSPAMDLEENYEVFIPDKDIEDFKRVEDISFYLDGLLNQAMPSQSIGIGLVFKTIFKPGWGFFALKSIHNANISIFLNKRGGAGVSIFSGSKICHLVKLSSH